MDASLERHPAWEALQRLRQGIERLENWVEERRERMKSEREKEETGEREEARARWAELRVAVERDVKELKAR